MITITATVSALPAPIVIIPVVLVRKIKIADGSGAKSLLPSSISSETIFTVISQVKDQLEYAPGAESIANTLIKYFLSK